MPCDRLGLWNWKETSASLEKLEGKQKSLTGSEGNHKEDVEKNYYYLDATPTYSYARALYKYPQSGFPYRQVVEENRRRGLSGPEFELAEAGVFDDNRIWMFRWNTRKRRQAIYSVESVQRTGARGQHVPEALGISFVSVNRTSAVVSKAN